MRTCRMAYGAAAAVLLAGCAASAPSYHRVVNRWGAYPVEEGVELRVSAIGMTQMRYELRHTDMDRPLLTDMGRDTRGWFFVWDDQDRLWGHWGDLGTVVWLPKGSGRFEKHWLTPDSPLLRDVPPEVSENLPAWARKSLGLATQ